MHFSTSGSRGALKTTKTYIGNMALTDNVFACAKNSLHNAATLTRQQEGLGAGSSGVSRMVGPSGSGGQKRKMTTVSACYIHLREMFRADADRQLV